VTAACAGAAAVVHLGGIPTEDAWSADPRGQHQRHLHGLRGGQAGRGAAGGLRLVQPRGRVRAARVVPGRRRCRPVPDTYYGVSKAAGEALAACTPGRYDLEAICVRILSCFDRPRSPRMLATWLSPDDAGRLFEACLTAPAPGFRVIYGVSANTRGGWVSLDGARALGYEPRDDAEAYAAQVLAGTRTPAEAPAPAGKTSGPTRPTRSSATWAGEFTLPSRDAPVPPAVLVLAGHPGVVGDDARRAAAGGGRGRRRRTAPGSPPRPGAGPGRGK